MAARSTWETSSASSSASSLGTWLEVRAALTGPAKGAEGSGSGTQDCHACLERGKDNQRGRWPQGQNWKEPPDSEPCPRPAGSEGQARAPVLLGLGRKRRCEGASFSRRTDSSSAWAGRQQEAPGPPTCFAHTDLPALASPLFPRLPRAPSCSTKGMCDFSSEDERKCRIGDSPLFTSIKPTNLEIQAGIQRGIRLRPGEEPHVGVTAQQARAHFRSASSTPQHSGRSRAPGPGSTKSQLRPALGPRRQAQGEGQACVGAPVFSWQDELGRVVSGAPDAERRDPHQLGASGSFCLLLLLEGYEGNLAKVIT
ncbi:uncharacterized protein LOC117802020 [Ailuropoda melanoleuca]|uniref:uncharacterized protein LOC117802020 n=1 Tax=Ailuropoda melanoleuca TaxID=9646 RepID=UPI0014950361|nr:uncharacterized protein LOC117802020 [Ailuropoda melanoleuca]